MPNYQDFIEFKPTRFTSPGVAIVLVSVFFLARWLIKKKTPLPYPPGPKPLPLIGNALDIPLSRPWETYTRWGEQYGSLSFVSALGFRILVINSVDVAVDLLEERSNIYSDRPDMPVAELTGWDMTMATHRYGNLWRKHRARYHHKFKQESVHQFGPLLESKVHELLRKLLATPDDRVEHIRHYPAATIMYICYGHNIAHKNDRLVDISEAAAKEVAETIVRGSQIVNIFPFARHLPDWFPGFQRRARECRKKVHIMMNVPYRSVRQHMAAGHPIPSWMSEMLQENDAKGGGKDEEEIIKGVTASSFAAAHDTTTSVLQFFVLAMILFPEVQNKAQEEIDRVIGTDRLPTFDDYASLPYIEAIYRELLRWRPPTVIGVPHAVTTDDVYGGYFIPKGTIIFANIWGMCHDPAVFLNPEDFVPERFLTQENTLNNPRNITFGFGRRVCVGSALAHETIWIAIAIMLSVFRFAKAKTSKGEDIDVSADFPDSLVIHPFPFPCSITPRSQQCRDMILNTPELKLDSLQLQWS